MAHLTRRTFRPDCAAITRLPFVADVSIAPRKKRRNFWHVPQTDDYGAACDLGRQYACDLLQYLKDNPGWFGSGLIGWLVEDMAAYPVGCAMHGYQVGFWSALELVLRTSIQANDHWTIVQCEVDRYAALAHCAAAPTAEGSP